MEWDDLSLHHLKKMFFHYVSNSVIGMAGLSFNVFTDTFLLRTASVLMRWRL